MSAAMGLEEQAQMALSALSASVGNADVETVAGQGAPMAGSPAHALRRLQGTVPQHRHAGVTHVQHPGGAGHVSAHKPAHPHAHVAHEVKSRAPHVHHEHTRSAKRMQTAVQLAQHHRSKAHLSSVPGELSVEVGTVVAYSAPTSGAAGSASVQLQGSVARLLVGLPITQGMPADLVVLGAQCLVALLDPANPQDALVLGVYNAPPVHLWQGESATVVVGGGAASGTLFVAFPTAYTVAAHSVVACSGDQAWHAVVLLISTTGFTIQVRNVLGGVGPVSVPCTWMACGV